MSDSENLIFLVYISSAQRAYSDEQLIDLLRTAREYNEAHQITGMLLYKDGNFLQVLEGPERAVWKLYARIRTDAGHAQVTTLVHGPLPQRQFEGWSMGFQNVRDMSPEDLATFSPYLTEPFTEDYFGEQPHKALTLLQSFKRSERQQHPPRPIG